MDALGQIAQASRSLAPGVAGDPSVATDITTTAATATAATATGISTSRGQWFSVAVGVAFNIRFGGASLADPADTASFPAGLYSWWLDPTQLFFKITANATGKATYWRGSQ